MRDAIRDNYRADRKARMPLEINERSNLVIASAVEAHYELVDVLEDPGLDDAVRLRILIAFRLLDSALYARIGAQDDYVGEIRADLDQLIALRSIGRTDKPETPDLPASV